MSRAGSGPDVKAVHKKREINVTRTNMEHQQITSRVYAETASLM